MGNLRNSVFTCYPQISTRVRVPDIVVAEKYIPIT